MKAEGEMKIEMRKVEQKPFLRPEGQRVYVVMRVGIGSDAQSYLTNGGSRDVISS